MTTETLDLALKLSSHIEECADILKVIDNPNAELSFTLDSREDEDLDHYDDDEIDWQRFGAVVSQVAKTEIIEILRRDLTTTKTTAEAALAAL